MIINAVLTILLAIIQFQFDIVPNIPMVDPLVMTTINSYVTMMLSPIHLVRYILSDTVFNTIIISYIIMFNFKYIYGMTMFVIRKIPILNIR